MNTPASVNRSVLRLLVTLLLAAASTLGCARDPRKLSLLDAPAAAPAVEGEAERQRLEQMQLVRVVNSAGEESTLTADQFYQLIAPVPGSDLQGGDCGRDVVCPTGNSTNHCAYSACLAQIDICVARLMQSVAMIRAGSVKFNPSSGPYDFQVPGQSAATNAAILRKAFEVIQGRMATAATFATCPSMNSFPHEAIPGVPTTTFGPAAGSLYTNAVADTIRLSQELAADTVDAIVAVADAQRSDSLDLRQGAARSVAGEQLSRSEAAHLLIGGDSGLMGSYATPFCAMPELTGRARRALALIRRAAPNPVTVKASGPAGVAMDKFLNADLTTLPDGSIAARLAYLDGRCSGNPASCTIVPIQQQTGISTEDFAQARAFLAQEFDAFSRSSAATFIPSRIGVPATVGFQFYAATRNAPTPPPPEYYSALARYVKPGWTAPPDGALRAGLAMNLTTAFGNVRNWSPGLVNSARNSFSVPPGQPIGGFPDLWKLIDGGLSAVLSEDPRRGAIEFYRNAGNTITINVYGFGTADRVMLLKGGMDGLLCATRGSIDGAACTTLNPYHAATFSTNVCGPKYGFPKCVNVSNITVSDSNVPLFLVRPKNPNHEQTGAYDHLVGFVVNNTVVNGLYVHPIVPELDRKAGEILRPSTRWCTRSALECDGTVFDERLPLENELSDDGDGIESSWKHYLTLAEQAANEVHALGAEYVQNGTEVDRQTEMAQLRAIGDQQRFATQAEGELETVQDICGTAMSTEDMLGLVGVNLTGFSTTRACSTTADCCLPGPSNCTHSTCTSNFCAPTQCLKDSDCCSGSGCEHKCVSNLCSRTVDGFLATPTATEGLSRLQECVGDGSVAPYAILGTQQVCIWTSNTNSNSICDKASTEFPCPAPPRVATGGGLTCAGISVPPTGVTPPELVDGFTYRGSYFDVKLGLIPTGAGYMNSQDPCIDLRKLRNNFGIRKSYCNRLRPWDSDYFIGHDHDDDAKIVDTLSARYTWTEAKGPRVELLQGERVRWSTGGIGGSTTTWPCADHPFATTGECTNVPNSLFCQKVNCSATSNAADLQSLARVNQRIVEAATLLKGLSHMDFEKIVVPAAFPSVDLGMYSPIQALEVTDLGTHIKVKYSGKEPLWGGPLTFDTFVPDGSPLPVFFKHYARDSGAFISDYSIASDGYRALVPLPQVGFAYPDLRNLITSSALCGDTPATAFESGMAARLWGQGTLPTKPLLPKGNELAGTPASIASGAVPDLPYLTTRFRYDDQGIADAAELLCEASREVKRTIRENTSCGSLDPTTLTAVDDFKKVVEYTNCRAGDFERSIGSLVLPRVPFRVLQGIHDSSQGGFPAVGGQMGAQMHRLRAALIRFGELNVAMRDSLSEVREAVEDMNFAVQQVQVRFNQEQTDVENAQLLGTQSRIRLNQIDFQAQAAWTQATVDCAGGILAGIAGAVSSGGASLASGGASCASAIAAAEIQSENLNYERQIAEVEQTIAANNVDREGGDIEYVKLEHARDLIRHRGMIRVAAGRMGQLQTEMRASLEEITASLTELEALRLRVLRAIARATQYDSTVAAATRNIDSVLNAKLDISKRRYHRAHKNAIRLAFLAKRAIEQRLGVHLSELRADLPLVDAPSNWEAKVCTAIGIDYSVLANPDDGATEKRFEEAYIGDYVNNLKNVVESYRLEFDFQEGTDEVIASVRDDVFGTRQFCRKSLGNRLTHSGRINYLTSDFSQPGWVLQGCPVGPNGASSDCLSITPDTNSPLVPAPPYAPGVTFGNTDPITGNAPGFVMTWGATANLEERLAQRVTLSPGRYRMSWFSKQVQSGAMPPTPYAGTSVWLLDSSDATVAAATGQGMGPYGVWADTALNGWLRMYRFFDVKVKGDYLAVIKYGQRPNFRAGSIAGVMLEELNALDSVEALHRLRPPPYVETESDTARMVKVCEDTDGSAFRGQSWTRRCERLCRDGFSGSCEQSDRVSSCYWETTIGIDQRDLEEGVIFKHAGFAAGNFNYRIEDIGVNFVGSEVRNCEASQNPSACYAGGFVPYSLKHIGPYSVRNHEGSDFNVKLFTGNIEHARGLGLERYLTNPLSDTDRSLLAPYVRTEFQGRPFDGSLILRVWEAEGVDFNAIEDVQLYIKYRYWTRSQ